MEVKIWVTLGLVGGMILALAIAGYFGHAFGTTMNAIMPGTGDSIITMSNVFFGLAVITAIVVIIVAFIYAYQQSQGY
jgi:hypothetical protein